MMFPVDGPNWTAGPAGILAFAPGCKGGENASVMAPAVGVTSGGFCWRAVFAIIGNGEFALPVNRLVNASCNRLGKFASSTPLPAAGGIGDGPTPPNGSGPDPGWPSNAAEDAESVSTDSAGATTGATGAGKTDVAGAAGMLMTSGGPPSALCLTVVALVTSGAPPPGTGAGKPPVADFGNADNTALG